jgi:hypothetical protein
MDEVTPLLQEWRGGDRRALDALVPLYGSSSDKSVHSGMANDITAKSVEIQWPSGVRQRLQDVGCDRYLTITEPQ